MARYDDINAPMVAYAAIISCVFLFVVIQATQALTYFWTNQAEERALANFEYRSSVNSIREQRSSLSGYKWVVPQVEQEEGQPAPTETAEKKLHIPIERAQEVVLAEMVGAGT